MLVRDGIGLLSTIVIVAAVSAAIVRGEQTARLISSAGAAFAGLVRAATLQGGE